MTYLAFYDPDKKKPAREKVVDGMRRYAKKFGREAVTCLANPIDAKELAEDDEAPDITIKGMKFIALHCFYVGQED